MNAKVLFNGICGIIFLATIGMWFVTLGMTWYFTDFFFAALICIPLGMLLILGIRFFHIIGALVLFPVFCFIAFSDGGIRAMENDDRNMFKYMMEAPQAQIYKPSSLDFIKNKDDSQWIHEGQILRKFLYNIEYESEYSERDAYKALEQREAFEDWFDDHRYPEDGLPPLPLHKSIAEERARKSQPSTR